MVEEFRVLRDPTDGALVVEIDGTRYRRLTDITDGEVGRRFVAHVRALAHFALVLKGAPPPLPLLPMQPAAAPNLTRAASRSLPQPAMQPATTDAAEEAAAEPISLAEEIDRLVQKRLASTPQLASRSIHIRPGLHGGVSIVVDNRAYEGVDAVPEPDVRQLIQAAIQEWNARS